MKVKCTDDHRVFDKNGKQVAVYWENDTYEVDEKLGKELLATDKFEKVG